jgi:hypothetical protein
MSVETAVRESRRHVDRLSSCSGGWLMPGKVRSEEAVRSSPPPSRPAVQLSNPAEVLRRSSCLCKLHRKEHAGVVQALRQNLSITAILWLQEMRYYLTSLFGKCL